MIRPLLPLQRTRRHLFASAARIYCVLGLGILGMLPSHAGAEDVLKLHRRETAVRAVVHSDLVLAEAMRRTRAKYGSYRIEYTKINLVRERVLIEAIKGDQINAATVAIQPTWEERMIPVWIPLDMGVSSFRIGFVKRDRQDRLASVRNEADLKKLRVGVGLGWSSRQVFEANGLTLETAIDQAALTRMLLADRLDYFPRGVNEVFSEYDAMVQPDPQLAIDKELLLYFPLPNYVFVSPRYPRLAKRLTDGLESMVRDGTLLKMVKTYHAEMLQRAELCARHIIRLDNPFLSASNPLSRKELWFDPYDKKRGICNSVSTARSSEKAGKS
ncbi:hypothetical protein VVD49_05015 [Uliginosibacterium sp. H3]|uniref:Solute-binding protein family 3/N-terminal domain-containing protein n=1 Tax=Uliginosibacterium silvisoli TaxID=3114758 RepID=A0ABU6K0Z4_9RHOO|nr:hypothetical protein [Uliginosibacterium sp. H3]